MLKKTFKLVSIFILVLISFIYTNKVFSSIKSTDPLMKSIKTYKRKNDVKEVNCLINNDEVILGIPGLKVDVNESYKNMKNDGVFSKEKIIYKKQNIKNMNDYYIVNGNTKDKYVYIILVLSNNSINNIISNINNSTINVFVDGKYLENNINIGFDIVNNGFELYNLGYNNAYTKRNIDVTNNLIESITLKKSNYCLFINKNDKNKKICTSKNMYSIKPYLVNPNVLDIKKKLRNGLIISFDSTITNAKELNMIINIIKSKGYELKGLSSLNIN